VDCILSTLWSHIPPQDEYAVSHGLNDFYQTEYDGHRLTVADYNQMHRFCLDFIKKSVSESTARKIVVVTHHLPTLQVVAPQHKGSPINSAFATELGDFIAGSRIDCWIYGHSHTNIDTQIGDTKIVSNQLGNVFQKEHLHNSFSHPNLLEDGPLLVHHPSSRTVGRALEKTDMDLISQSHRHGLFSHFVFRIQSNVIVTPSRYSFFDL